MIRSEHRTNRPHACASARHHASSTRSDAERSSSAIVSTGPVQQTCTLSDDPWLPVWTTLERAPRTGEGRQIDVQHAQMRIEDTDE
jgi:hypothetical protein